MKLCIKLCYYHDLINFAEPVYYNFVLCTFIIINKKLSANNIHLKQSANVWKQWANGFVPDTSSSALVFPLREASLTLNYICTVYFDLYFRHNLHCVKLS